MEPVSQEKSDRKHEPRYIKLHPADNVAIIVNDFGLPAGSVFSDGLRLVVRPPTLRRRRRQRRNRPSSTSTGEL